MNFIKKLLVRLSTIAILFLTINSVLQSQNSSKPLSFFQPFIGTWEGHYQNSSGDEHIVHKISWKFKLDSNAVVQQKEVKELNFIMETTHYWDIETQQ